MFKYVARIQWHLVQRSQECRSKGSGLYYIVKWGVAYGDGARLLEGVHNYPALQKGQPVGLASWRPIFMKNTVHKLSAALLPEKVKRWSVTNQRYSDS